MSIIGQQQLKADLHTVRISDFKCSQDDRGMIYYFTNSDFTQLSAFQKFSPQSYSSPKSSTLNILLYQEEVNKNMQHKYRWFFFFKYRSLLLNRKAYSIKNSALQDCLKYKWFQWQHHTTLLKLSMNAFYTQKNSINRIAIICQVLISRQVQ